MPDFSFVSHQVPSSAAGLLLRPLRRWRAVIAAVGLMLGMLLIAASALSAATARRQTFNYLWAIPSASGSLTGTDDRHLVLRLVGLRDYLTRFTDRPIRKAYVVANADFVRRFTHYFGDANPNAVLAFSKDGNRIPTEIVLQVRKPHWNPKTSTMTFAAVRIPHMEDDLPDTTVHIRPRLIHNPAHFDAANLFIDSASSCGAASDTLATTALLC